jgi:hypothetical protein
MAALGAISSILFGALDIVNAVNEMNDGLD